MLSDTFAGKKMTTFPKYFPGYEFLPNLYITGISAVQELEFNTEN